MLESPHLFTPTRAALNVLRGLSSDYSLPMPDTLLGRMISDAHPPKWLNSANKLTIPRTSGGHFVVPDLKAY